VVRLEIKTNFADVQRGLDRLRSDVASKALASAVNRTIEQARTEMSREIRRDYRLSAAEVRERLRIKRASFRAGRFGIEASLTGTGKGGRGRSMNVIRFVERKVTLAEARRRGKAGTLNQLRVQIKTTGGPQVIKGAFIANKGRTVFIRKGKERLPIKAVQTIDVPQMFNAKRINSAVMRAIRDKFPRIAEREIAYFTARFNGGRA
jgi:Prophage minor tail protein Z (GPZ)